MIHLVKAGDEILIPLAGDEYTAEVLRSARRGDVLRGRFSKSRNPVFHRKFFAMLGVGYEAWEPGEIINRYGIAQKNFEQFRADATILAGFYEQFVRLDSSVRTVPKSISFDKMDEIEFRRVYSAVANVILQRVLVNYRKSDLDEVVERLLGFV